MRATGGEGGACNAGQYEMGPHNFTVDGLRAGLHRLLALCMDGLQKFISEIAVSPLAMPCSWVARSAMRLLLCYAPPSFSPLISTDPIPSGCDLVAS
jgi:hypothetical protein